MKSIDLHSHVVPPNILAAMGRDPDRFGAKGKSGNGVKVVDRDGKLYWETNSRLTEIERILYDVEAEIAELASRPAEIEESRAALMDQLEIAEAGRREAPEHAHRVQQQRRRRRHVPERNERLELVAAEHRTRCAAGHDRTGRCDTAWWLPGNRWGAVPAAASWFARARCPAA